MPFYSIDPSSRVLRGPIDLVATPGVGFVKPYGTIEVADVLQPVPGMAWILGPDDQPELVEDHRGTVYDISTAAPVDHTALGPLPDHLTPLVPPMRYPLWQASAWGTDMQTARTEAAQRIDGAVDAATYRVVGSRLAEYQQAETEAAAYRDAGYSGEVPSSVAAHVVAYSVTAQAAAESILAMAAAWRGVQMAMRVTRLTAKQQLGTAADLSAIDAIVEQARLSISAAVAPLVA